MSKIDSGLRTARECNMNMSAQILRTLVSEVFNMPPSQVILSGVMPQNFQLEEDHSSGSMYTCDVNHEVYAFEPAKGFIKVPGDTSGASSNANGSWNVEKKTTFAHCSNYTSSLFFVVIEDYKVHQEDVYTEKRNCTFYKAPDFHAMFAAIEQADIDRWEQWLQ